MGHRRIGAVVGLVVGQVLAAGVLFAFVASARAARPARRATAREGVPGLASPSRPRLARASRRTRRNGRTGDTAVVIARTLDLHALGLFAAAWAITNRLPALVYQTLNIYAMPRLSSLGNDWNAITREQNEALRLGLTLMAPILCLAIAASPWLVPILLSHAFLPAARILEIMFVGELLSVVFWTLSMGLFSTGRAAKFAAAEWGFWALLLASSAALAPILRASCDRVRLRCRTGGDGHRLVSLGTARARVLVDTRQYKLLVVSVAAVVAVAVTHGVATPIRVAFAPASSSCGSSSASRRANGRRRTSRHRPPDLLGETMMPRVSVIVTTYNSGRYVGETLASVAAQTFRDFEVVVADDGSSDDTREIARASGVVSDIVTGPNLGIGGNWARAFSHSSGELVAFIAGDDRWLPEHLETTVAAFERDPSCGRLLHGRPSDR